MRNIYYLFIILSILLFGCGKSNNQSGYTKIEPGMSYIEVVSILNKPNQENKIDIDGFSGTSASWRTKSGVIVIEFVNDKVQMKTMTKFNSKDTDNG